MFLFVRIVEAKLELTQEKLLRERLNVENAKRGLLGL
jgi:hypothetical protein